MRFQKKENGSTVRTILHLQVVVGVPKDGLFKLRSLCDINTVVVTKVVVTNTNQHNIIRVVHEKHIGERMRNEAA